MPIDLDYSDLFPGHPGPVFQGPPLPQGFQFPPIATPPIAPDPDFQARMRSVMEDARRRALRRQQQEIPQENWLSAVGLLANIFGQGPVRAGEIARQQQAERLGREQGITDQEMQLAAMALQAQMGYEGRTQEAQARAQREQAEAQARAAREEAERRFVETQATTAFGRTKELEEFKAGLKPLKPPKPGPEHLETLPVDKNIYPEAEDIGTLARYHKLYTEQGDPRAGKTLEIIKNKGNAMLLRAKQRQVAAKTAGDENLKAQTQLDIDAIEQWLRSFLVRNQPEPFKIPAAPVPSPTPQQTPAQVDPEIEKARKLGYTEEQIRSILEGR